MNNKIAVLTTAKTPWLNMRHTIFREVISGYDVVQKIENVETVGSDRPKQEQKIIKAYLKNTLKALKETH